MVVPSRPRLRGSILLVSAAAVALCILVVGAALSVLSYMNTRSVTEDMIRTRALEVTDLMARQSGGALKFGRPDPLVELFTSAISTSGGSARAAVAYDADAARVADVDGGSYPGLDSLAAQTLAEGDVARAPDGMAVAVPVRFGPDADVVGAVAMQWSPDKHLADLGAHTRRTLLIAAVLTMGAVLGAALFLRRFITRPLLRIGSAMETIGSGEFDTEVPCTRRNDEIGAIGGSLERFRDSLAEGEEVRKEATYKGAGFESSTAAMFMLDGDHVIRYCNGAAARLLRDKADDLRKVVPGFDPERIVGGTLADFHSPALASRLERQLSDPANLPIEVTVAAGETRLALKVSPVLDDAGRMFGTVMQWDDATEDTLNNAIIDAIERNQVMAEFDNDGRLKRANARFRELFEAASLADVPDGTLKGLIDLDALSDRSDPPVMDRLRGGDALTGRIALRRTDAVLEGTLSMVLDAARRPMRTVLIARDITQGERDIAAARASREEMQRRQSDVVDGLRVALRALRDGDLTARIESRFADEYEELRNDFNGAIDSFAAAMRHVVEIAETIRKESTEITSSADSLSSRTEKSAAALEETAAALEELTTSVNSAAQGADRANEVVGEARANAVQSGEVVREAVAAMSEIEDSSGKIARIIDVIEDIAFQTNLLALNAGVEAARAGEAGRGFAVVASEVRALAQRCSDAAREINDLISSSGVQVQRGVDLVDKTGKALEDIVGSVTKISDLVAGIATSANEQSTGVSEINTAVNQLDQSTQQNAAMFEETTAASHALTRVAGELADTVGRFQTGSTADGAADVVSFRRAGPGQSAAEAASPRSPRPAVPAPPTAQQAAAALPDTTEEDGWEEF